MITTIETQQIPKMQSTEDSLKPSSSEFAQHKISIAGISKPILLKCLWDNASSMGPAFCANHSVAVATALTPKLDIKVFEKEIQERLHDKRSLNFDYFYFITLKVDISGDDLITKVYDSHHGIGSAKRAVEMARTKTNEEKGLKCNLDELKNELPAINQFSDDALSELMKIALYPENEKA